MTSQRNRPLLLNGMEIVNSDDLLPGTLYYLVKAGERVTRKRGDNESRKVVLVRGVKSTIKSAICRVRVYKDRSNRRRLQEITEMNHE